MIQKTVLLNGFLSLNFLIKGKNVLLSDDARLKQQDAPENLNASFVVERHGALNWLIQHDGDWDNPDLNT